MKITKTLLPASALGLAVVMALPTESEAFSKLGFNLGNSRRSVRVFNNFTDSQANDNQTPDPNFPGFQGANMALWKAAIEWNSISHGNGQGDPTQPNLGDGGANFDAAWMGEATGPGVIGNNIMAELAGSSGGVLAFMQGGSGGWWIKFYSTWTWADGPSNIPGGQFDLQAVGCHEYGHALGLGHTSAGGATMFPSIGSGNVSFRSIEADDKAGLQCIYGVMSSTKPVITDININGNQITVNGTNFPTSSAAVVFTRSNPSSPSNSGLLQVGPVSTTGTSVTVTIPNDALPGQVHIRDLTTNLGRGLSNSWPADPGACDAIPTTYCTGKQTSQGFVPTMSFTGTGNQSTNNLVLRIFLGPPNKPGVIIFSEAGPAAIPFQGGFLCVNPQPLQRGDTFAFDNFGRVFIPLNITVGMIGTTRNYQGWGRDTVANGSMLSDAGEVTFCP